MADSDLKPSRIGPTIDLADVALPPDVANELAALYGADEPIHDAAAWAAAIRESSLRERDRLPSIADLCTDADGAHAFEARDGDERRAYVCVLDPLVYPVLTDTPGTVRSETPVRGETVTMTVTEDGVDVSHPEAVVSLGVADDAGDVASPSLEILYGQACAYIHVFADEDEYAAWANEVAAATTSVPVERGVALAMGLAAALFDGAPTG